MSMQTQTQFAAARRHLADQVLERMAQDPGFQQAMTHRPEEALSEAGFAAQLAESDAWEGELSAARPCPYSCWATRCTSLWSL